MKNAVSSLVLISLLCTANGAYAQPSNKKSSKATGSVSNERHADSPLDIAAISLTPNYVGHSCRAIVKKLSSFTLEKGEFETTVAYNSRMDQISNGTAIGTTRLNDTVGFVPSRSVFSPLSQSYDADRGILKVSGFWYETTFVSEFMVSSIKLDHKLKLSREYEGANVYGRTVTVSSDTWDTCALAISNSPHSGLEWKLKRIEEKLEMSPDEAREAKGNVEIMYVGTLASPYRVEYRDYKKPTIDRPEETRYKGDALVMNLAQLWIFNRKTGAIYRKVDF